MRNALLWFAFVAATVSCALASAWLIAGCVSDYRPPHDLGADEVPLGLEEECVGYTTAVEVVLVQLHATARSQAGSPVDCWVCTHPEPGMDVWSFVAVPAWPGQVHVGGAGEGWTWEWECYQEGAAESCWGEGAR